MEWDVHTAALRVLRAVEETGSFSAAGEAMGFTQSAVSKQVRTLETTLGVRLFDRTPRGVLLTAAGRLLSVRAAAVLDQLDGAVGDVAGLSRDVSGRVRLGGFPTSGVGLLPRAVARVNRSAPRVDVVVELASTPVLFRRLRAGNLDVAVLATGEDLPRHDLRGFLTEPLPTGPLRIAIARDHRLAAQRRVSVDDTVDEPWIGGQGAPGDPQFGAWPTLREPRIAARARDLATRLGFVAAGLGVTTIPTIAVEAAPQGVRTVVVDDPDISRRSLVLAGSRRASAAEAEVVGALRAEASRLSSLE